MLATAVMMFPVALSVAKLIADKGGSSQFPLALMLSVAYAASIGGIGTLIGTPPNALLAGALNQTYGYDIGFAQWMIFGMPIMLVMLFGAWLLLTRVSIRLDRKTIEGADELFHTQLTELGAWSKAEKRVALVFVVTALLWIFRTLLQNVIPGLSDASIAVLAAIALFIIPSGDKEGGGLVDWSMTKNLPWGILVLQQLIEHAHATLGHLTDAHALGEAHAGVQLAQALQRSRWVWQAGAGETPGADGRTDKRALARRSGQPVAKQGDIQPLNAQRLGPACCTGQRADIAGLQATLTDARQSALAGLEGEGRELDLNGAHAGLR